MTLFTLKVVQQIQLEAKHRDNISSDSRSDSKSSSQAQDMNILDVQLEPHYSKLKASSSVPV